MTTVNEIRAETDRLRTAHFHALADRLAQAQSLARRIVEARKRASELRDARRCECDVRHEDAEREWWRAMDELVELLAGKETK